MRTHSTTAQALILSARSLSAARGRKQVRSDVAIAWVEQAIAAGCGPFMRQEPLSSSDQAGEWLLAISKDAATHPYFPGMPTDEHFDEVFVILARLGRLRPDATLRPWHGNVLPEDSSARAVALRIKIAREFIGLGQEAFYGACRMNLNAGRALEEGHRAFASIDNEMLPLICAQHGIPEDWVMFGTAEEIES
jgi:hypothetical protein